MQKNTLVACGLLGLIVGHPGLAQSPSPAPLPSVSPSIDESPERRTEQLLIFMTNTERGLEKLPPLEANSKLSDCARDHSEEMAVLKYFAHLSPTPGMETKRQRVEAVGLHPVLVAENLYMSEGRPLHDLPERAMNAWMASSGHRDNIMDPRYNSIGIGLYVYGRQTYVTQVFSTDKD